MRADAPDTAPWRQEIATGENVDFGHTGCLRNKLVLVGFHTSHGTCLHTSPGP